MLNTTLEFFKIRFHITLGTFKLSLIFLIKLNKSLIIRNNITLSNLYVYRVELLAIFIKSKNYMLGEKVVSYVCKVILLRLI